MLQLLTYWTKVIRVQMIWLSVLGKSKAVCQKVTASSNESGEMFST